MEKWKADPERVKAATRLVDVLTQSGAAVPRLNREPLPSERIEPMERFSMDLGTVDSGCFCSGVCLSHGVSG